MQSVDDLLDQTEKNSLAEVNRLIGTETADNEWGWDSIAEIFLHPVTRETFEDYLRSRPYPEFDWYLNHADWVDLPVVVDTDLFNTDLHQCYYNCQTGAMPGTKVYHEGWALRDGRAFPHAWLVEDGEILEPTYPVAPDAYYGMPFEYGDISRSMEEREVADPLVEMFV